MRAIREPLCHEFQVCVATPYQEYRRRDASASLGITGATCAIAASTCEHDNAPAPTIRLWLPGLLRPLPPRCVLQLKLPSVHRYDTYGVSDVYCDDCSRPSHDGCATAPTALVLATYSSEADKHSRTY